MANIKPNIGNPRLQDPEYASEMGRRGMAVRYANKNKNKPTHAQYQEQAEAYIKHLGLKPEQASPLYYWLGEMTDPSADPQLRQRASEKVAQYTLVEPHTPDEPDPKLIDATPEQTANREKLQAVLMGLINNQQSPTSGVTPSPSVHGSGSNVHHPQAAEILDAELLPPVDDHTTSVPPVADPRPAPPANVVPLSDDPTSAPDTEDRPHLGDPHNAASAEDRPHSSDPTPQAEAHIGSTPASDPTPSVPPTEVQPAPDDTPPPEPPTLEELLTMDQGPTHQSTDKRLGHSLPHAATPNRPSTTSPTKLPSMAELNAEHFPKDDT